MAAVQDKLTPIKRQCEENLGGRAPRSWRRDAVTTRILPMLRELCRFSLSCENAAFDNSSSSLEQGVGVNPELPGQFGQREWAQAFSRCFRQPPLVGPVTPGRLPDTPRASVGAACCCCGASGT